MEGKYTRKLLRKLRKKLPEGMPVKVIFSQTIKPSLHEYYLIFVDGFQYTVYEKAIEKEGAATAASVIASLYLEDKMNEILTKAIIRTGGFTHGI